MTTAKGHTSAMRAKKVIGSNVADTAGTKIGHVEDVVLDKQRVSAIGERCGGLDEFGRPGECFRSARWES